MTKPLSLLATTAALAAAAVLPAAGLAATAAHAGQTVAVHDKTAYVDNKAPGRIFVGTLLKGDSFKIDRVATVFHGPAKGVWYHGKATGKPGNHTDAKGHHITFTITGWVRAAAFS